MLGPESFTTTTTTTSSTNNNNNNSALISFSQSQNPISFSQQQNFSDADAILNNNAMIASQIQQQQRSAASLAPSEVPGMDQQQMMMMMQQQQQMAGVSAAQNSKRRKAVCPSSVLGRIVVTDMPTGEKISQWGGVEAYLSFISGHGPCLVVRGSKHKRGDGTFFQLRAVERVLHQHVEKGKLTVQVPHQKRQCMIFVEVKDAESLPQLALMATTLDDRRRWSDLEMNVGRGFGDGGVNAPGRRGRKKGGGGGAGDGDGEIGEAVEVVHTRPEARDALLNADEDLNFS